MSPEGAATFAAYEVALAKGVVSRTERVVLFNCGNGLEYPMPPAECSLDHTRPIDWDTLATV